MNKIIIGVSSCLCGNAVRHDGASKRSTYVTNTLAEYFELKPVCPELSIGLGVPRPTLRLRRKDGEARLTLSKHPDSDITEAMHAWADAYLPTQDSISGFILKNGSPSCGMERVRLYDSNDIPKKEGIGIFAAKLMQHYPALPVEEEGRLNDAVLRENFIQRVYVYHRWQQMITEGLNVARLMDFHRRHKLMLLAHDEAKYRELGPIIASLTADNIESIAQRYIHELMHSLSKRASRKRHTNVLMHVFGFIKKQLDSPVKREILAVLDNYRTGYVPLVVPLTLLRHYLSQYPDEYIEQQYYLEPYPEALMLRNQL